MPRAVIPTGSSFLFTLLTTAALVHAGPPTNPAGWNFKAEFIVPLVQSVPETLKNQDKASGRFGTGIWLPGDQSVIYPLAAAWAINEPGNPWHHDEKLLEAIMAGGDLLINAQDKDGRWIFRKKDNSTWGKHFDPWVYSRWIRTFSLISEAMPQERRERWKKALELGYAGVEKHELSHVQNIPAHHAMGLFIAGKVLNHPEWCVKASEFLVRVAKAQDPAGFWSEHVGPVVHYDFVYTDALGTYYGISHDKSVLGALERAARFHANFTYPDGSNIETIDERNPYLNTKRLPGVGFSFSPKGRSFLQQQWQRLKQHGIPEAADMLASLLLYGEQGTLDPASDAGGDATFLTQDRKASVIHQGSWCASLSAYACPVFSSRWIQDRQNLVSLFHEKTGLILGGGNTKLQPLWSSFTVGDTSLLRHRAGNENPDFKEPAGLLHVPSRASLQTNGHSLALEYGAMKCRLSLDLSEQDKTRLTYAADCMATGPVVAAHAILLPSLGKTWRTAAGQSGELGAKPLNLSGSTLGNWFEHNGWRVELPENATLVWPVLPHNPYRKDGHAEVNEARIVVNLPFSENVRTQTIVIILSERGKNGVSLK